MGFIPATNVLMVNILMQLFGRTVENTLYVERATAIDSGGVDDVATWVKNDLVDELLPTMVSALSVMGLYSVDLSTDNSPAYTHPFSPAAVGGDVRTPAPASLAMCVSFRTTGRGKSSRGRNYVPGIANADITDNQLGGTFIADVIAAYENFRVGASKPVDWTWGVLSRYHNKVARTAALFQPITAVVSTGIRVDSQRRRTGRN